MNTRNVARAAAADSKSSSRFLIFDLLIWAIALGLLILLVAVSGCSGVQALPGLGF